jgi:hypothetical protein
MDQGPQAGPRRAVGALPSLDERILVLERRERFVGVRGRIAGCDILFAVGFVLDDRLARRPLPILARMRNRAAELTPRNTLLLLFEQSQDLGC